LKILYSGEVTGGFGNRLFQYNFLAQIALNFNFTYRWESNRDFFNVFGMSIYNPMSPLIRKNKVILKKSVFDSGSYSEIKDIISTTSKPYLFIEPGILGEYFHSYTRIDPKKIIKVRKNIFRTDSYVAVHFRGRDMISHSPLAILSGEFYINAIELALSKSKIGLKVVLCTDDIHLQSYHEVLTYFKNTKVTLEFPQTKPRNFLSDFNLLMNSDYLVSSPSTFAIWAGILSNNCKIIQSKTWFDIATKKDDLFWVQSLSQLNRYYKIFDIV
jgi:hypothetical protein